MYCKKCGYRILEKDKQCPSCGMEIRENEYCNGFWNLAGSSGHSGSEREEPDEILIGKNKKLQNQIEEDRRLIEETNRKYGKWRSIAVLLGVLSGILLLTCIFVSIKNAGLRRSNDNYVNTIQKYDEALGSIDDKLDDLEEIDEKLDHLEEIFEKIGDLEELDEKLDAMEEEIKELKKNIKEPIWNNLKEKNKDILISDDSETDSAVGTGIEETGAKESNTEEAGAEETSTEETGTAEP